MRRQFLFLYAVLLLLACSFSHVAQPAATVQSLTYLPLVIVTHSSFYAAPDGKPSNDGSLDSPWDLATALNQPQEVHPGDTIWLRGGTYRGFYISNLEGAEGMPITVRQYPGERATIDSSSITSTVALDIEGAWGIYWGFEVMNSNPQRVTTTAGSFPPDLVRATGVNVNAPHTKLINLAVHDTGNGAGLWTTAVDSEIYGCLIYNNGWQGPDRGHGHAIYTQNLTGTKSIADNIMFNQFGYGIHAYGLPDQFLQGFLIEGNVSFNNGSLSAKGQSPNILVGGDTPAARATLLHNFTYQSSLDSVNVDLGYNTTQNQDIAARDNYFAGGNPVVGVRSWQQAALIGNTIVGDNTLVNLLLPISMPSSNYQWNDNTYYWGGKNAPFIFQGQAADIAGWQGLTGLDTNNQFSLGLPSGLDVFVRPNRYETGRANIIVYNWELTDTVDVDVSGVLTPGATYEVRNAQDYFGLPVATGVYTGTPLRLPLGGIPAPQAIGSAQAPPITGPEFNVFVVTSTQTSSK